MISVPDFSKKQIAFVFFNEGEKLAISNSNLTVKREDGSVKFQCTCYRLFLVFAVGNFSITSAMIRDANRFGFYIAVMSASFHPVSIIGPGKEGNTLLRRAQYRYEGIGIARHITQNKIFNQIAELKSIRYKSEAVKEAITFLNEYREKAMKAETLNELMAFEGLASKMYFKNHFNNVEWHGRQPRIKRDYLNAALDIGYTVLFSFIDALLESFGFDPYCGVMHTQFYMRKSLVCDLVEPFRPLIEHAAKSAIHQRQITEKDFTVVNAQYRLNWSESTRYSKIFAEPLVKRKDDIFIYIRDYYRAFMKQISPEHYPVFKLKDTGTDKGICKEGSE